MDLIDIGSTNITDKMSVDIPARRPRRLRMMSRADSDDPLYEVAVAVEADHELTAEMAEWEVATNRGRA
jgi:hypothetical protein